jgi:hypothetical protein
MIDKATVERVTNWARWAHTPRGARLSACMSIEHRYRPERLLGDEMDDRRTPALVVDVRDALLVWRAISPANGFPTRWYLALSARFVLRLSGYEFAGYMRRHKVPVGRTADEHDGLVYEALSAARNAIRRADLAGLSRLRYKATVPSGHGSEPLERLSASDSERAA